MSRDLSKIGDRERLKPRREPYWQRLRAGCFLGFRPSKRGGKGTWIARVYDEHAQKYRYKSMGDFGAIIGNKVFTTAKKEAEKVAEQIESGGVVNKNLETVSDACRLYAEERPEAQQRFTRYVYDDPISNVKLTKLRKWHLSDWRLRLTDTPSLVSRRKTGEREYRKRAPATVNRDMVVLRAALAKVIPPGSPNTDAAWQEALKPIPDASRRRTLYLDREQRRMLLAQLDGAEEAFVRALCLLPLRPQAVASLVAGEFDRRTSELTIGRDKAGKHRRIKVSPEASKLLASQSDAKPANVLLFMRANGKPWNKNNWNVPIKAAAEAAQLPRAISAYTIRHSVITDLVRAGLPLLTIAQISGTSAEMIERHYGHLANDAAVRALAELAL